MVGRRNSDSVFMFAVMCELVLEHATQGLNIEENTVVIFQNLSVRFSSFLHHSQMPAATFRDERTN